MIGYVTPKQTRTTNIPPNPPTPVFSSNEFVALDVSTLIFPHEYNPGISERVVYIKPVLDY